MRKYVIHKVTTANNYDLLAIACKSKEKIELIEVKLNDNFNSF